MLLAYATIPLGLDNRLDQIISNILDRNDYFLLSDFVSTSAKAPLIAFDSLSF